MTLQVKSTAKTVTVEYVDGRHTSTWTLDASLTDDELAGELRRIVAFYDAQTGREPLPQRIPGFALGMAQTAHPEPVDPDAPVPYTPVAPVTGNGWAAMGHPQVPEGADYELIPPEEQG
jgi:hypothetical protein